MMAVTERATGQATVRMSTAVHASQRARGRGGIPERKYSPRGRQNEIFSHHYWWGVGADGHLSDRTWRLVGQLGLEEDAPAAAGARPRPAHPDLHGPRRARAPGQPRGRSRDP